MGAAYGSAFFCLTRHGEAIAAEAGHLRLGQNPSILVIPPVPPALLQIIQAGDWRRGGCRRYLSPCGRESVFLQLPAVLSPSKCLENALLQVTRAGDRRKGQCRRYLSPCGRESVFLRLRVGLSPSKCLENAREGFFRTDPSPSARPPSRVWIKSAPPPGWAKIICRKNNRLHDFCFFSPGNLSPPPAALLQSVPSLLREPDAHRVFGRAAATSPSRDRYLEA